MTAKHHPSDDLLSDFAGGHLDEGQSLAIATHIERCPRCRTMVGALEHSAGDALAAIEPVAMAESALEKALHLLDAPAPTVRRAPAPTVRRAPARRVPRPAPAAAHEAWLPEAVRGYSRAGWKWVAPGVSMQPIMLPRTSPTRAFLLKSAKGTSMLQHTHSGLEMTCVLTGSFAHQDGVFAPGDFDFGDDSVAHQPIVGSDEDCICLVAMTGELELQGLMGRLIQPFIRL